MSREITDTKNKFTNQDLPDGEQDFMVVGDIVKKYGGKGGEFFIVTLQYPGGIGQQAFLPNMMGPLLRALGCDETEENKFDWDTQEQAGKKFKAKVSHAPDKKDKAIIRQHMSEIKRIGAVVEIEF